jgi:agmatine deiminase
MPAEEDSHEATWMSWPSRNDVWGEALPDVQDAIADLAVAIATFEPVRMLARRAELRRVRRMVGDADIDVIEGPVDDLWARDSLPCFLVATGPDDEAPLAAGRFRFNGWGGKQVHDGDTRLAALVAKHLGIPMIDSGLTGEGGGLEVDGQGTVLAARSSWVNKNRNPGLSEAEIGRRIVGLLGAERIVWVDGLAGEDITDSHIDTLARFSKPGLIVLDRPAFDDPGEVWFDTSVKTKNALAAVDVRGGGPFDFAELVQPTSPRGKGTDFLSSYVNYYVCNGAVITPSFGDRKADQAAAETLRTLYPGREIVQVDIDPIAAGGGGIHCATQQQPATTP